MNFFWSCGGSYLIETMGYVGSYLEKGTRGIQKVLRQILKNTLIMKFTKLLFYIFSIQFTTLL